MKKFLLLAFCAVFGMVQNSFAQELKITNNGVEVQENDMINVYPQEDDFGDVSWMGNEPSFTSDSAAGVPIEVTIKIPGSAQDVFEWCGIEMACQPIGPGTYTRKANVSNSLLGSKNLGLHAVFTPGKFVEYSIKVVVKSRGRNFRTFYVNYIYDGKDHSTGIDGVGADAETVKFMDNVCYYDFATAAPRALQVYGMDGKLVYNTVISAQQGSVSLNALQKGAYVYSVVENGKKAMSGKVLVK